MWHVVCGVVSRTSMPRQTCLPSRIRYNDELTRLIAKRGRDYARRFFRFALLEYLSMKVDDDVVIRREGYWKEVLLSRGKYGYNKN